jgi:hypothetical protein
VLFFQIPSIDTNPDNDGGPDDTGTLLCTNSTIERLLSNGNGGDWLDRSSTPAVRYGSTATTHRASRAIYGYRVRINGVNMTGKGVGTGAKVVALVE